MSCAEKFQEEIHEDNDQKREEGSSQAQGGELEAGENSFVTPLPRFDAAFLTQKESTEKERLSPARVA